ncbi:MAG TPA: heme NO-binding domain-containing protein [Ktedonobacterales bacterium]|jgi:hypothetical protein
MHGLIFVTWESYLSEQFGPRLLEDYRAVIGETWENRPLASRVYDDATLLKGVTVATTLTLASVDELLRGYGRYFLLNGLTGRLCTYLLDQVNSGRDLLLAMCSAHKQMGSATEGVTPPLFDYQALAEDTNGLILHYDSPRKLCPLLLGAIEGAAERYHQEAQVREVSCMKLGAPACRFEIHFSAADIWREAPKPQSGHVNLQELANVLYGILPDSSGITLLQLREVLRRGKMEERYLRPYLLLTALSHLYHAGWVASTANQPGDNLENRRYWRVRQVL